MNTAQQSPKNLLNLACENISSYFTEYGFEYFKSYKKLVKHSLSSDFIYEISFGTARGNRTGTNVTLNSHVHISSQNLLDFRKQLFNKHMERELGDPDSVVLDLPTGYLSKRKSYMEGRWNLYEAKPKNIFKELSKQVFPFLELFEDYQINMDALTINAMRYFTFEYRALDFFMCFAGKEVAQSTLSSMVAERGWYEKVSDHYSKFENERSSLQNKDMIALLSERAYLYGLEIQ